jgi:hydrocephalus-inducing protein
MASVDILREPALNIPSFYRYSIYPVNDINFGAMVVNSKKPRSFIIENKGEYDFKYTIQKLVKAAEVQQQRSRP